MAALLDTGFMLAVIDADDNLHAACVAALELETNPILPDVVLPELAYLILRELGYSTLTRFLRAVVAGELTQAQSTSQDRCGPLNSWRNTPTTKLISLIA